jgi:hypothetical protein
MENKYAETERSYAAHLANQRQKAVKDKIDWKVEIGAWLTIIAVGFILVYLANHK